VFGSIFRRGVEGRGEERRETNFIALSKSSLD